MFFCVLRLYMGMFSSALQWINIIDSFCFSEESKILKQLIEPQVVFFPFKLFPLKYVTFLGGKCGDLQLFSSNNMDHYSSTQSQKASLTMSVYFKCIKHNRYLNFKCKTTCPESHAYMYKHNIDMKRHFCHTHTFTQSSFIFYGRIYQRTQLSLLNSRSNQGCT